MKKRGIYAFAAAGAAALAVHAQAPGPKPEDQVKLRKAAYNLMNYSFGALGAMAEGKRPFNKDEAVRNAELLAQVATVPKRFFGEGTGEGETRAKPEIWKNRADFDAKMDKMVNETARLAQVARGGDLEALKKAVHEVDNACTACHDDYRAKRRG